jgi:hypothetical protein
MNDDTWLMDMALALRQARTPDELRDVVERLEDRYDAFSGPGQDLVDRLLDDARRRLVHVA